MNLQEYLKNFTKQNENVQDFRPGDRVRVLWKIREGDKERIQRFEGVVIRKRGEGVNKTFTVREVFQGYGVERIYPLYSPNLVKVEVLRKGKVRRAKLYYLREKVGKIRIKERKE